jgi:hypothetical protein
MLPGVLRAALLGGTWLVVGCTLPLAGRGTSGEKDDAGPSTAVVDAASIDTASIDATGGDEMALPVKPALNPDAGKPKTPGVPEASTTDRPDAGPPPPDPCAGSSGACVTVPSGWTLVAFAPAQTSPCPSGFAASASQDVVEGPSAPGACSCGTCHVTQPPSCAAGTIAVNFDNASTGMCDKVANPSPLSNSPAGSCLTDIYQGDYSVYDVQYTAPPPGGGACASAAVQTASAVSYAAKDRVCQPDSSQAAACDGGMCHPGLSGPYAACIAAPGSVACPPGPLSVAHQVGTSASFSCADCSCSVTASCSGTLTLYTDTGCTRGAYGISTGVCVGISSAATYKAYEYTAGAPTNVACQAGAAGPAQNLALTSPQTVCCAQ